MSLYDVDGGTVFLAEEDGMSLRRAAVMSDGDENGDHHHPERVSLGQGTLGRAALERRAQLVHGSGSRGDARGRSTIYAPMISSGKLVGVICLTTRPSRLTGRGELLLLQAFANRVGEILASGERGPARQARRRRWRASAPPGRPPDAGPSLGLSGLLAQALERALDGGVDRGGPLDVAQLENATHRRIGRHHESQPLAVRPQPARQVEEELDSGAVEVGRPATGR